MDDRANSFPIIFHPFLEKGLFPMNTIILFFQPYVNFTFIYEYKSPIPINAGQGFSILLNL
jgi:hypothetical protein